MPGRGQPWKKGGHIDETIDSADIIDGTIKEVDLDSALQAKVNTSGGHTIQDEGTPLVQRGNLNFVGAGVVASDGIEDTTTVTIAGGGSLARDTLADPFTEWWFYDEFFYPDFASADDQFSHLDVLANGKSVPSAQIGGVVQIATSTVANNSARINTCGAGLVAVVVTKKFRVVWKVKKGTVTTEAVVAGLTANQNEPAGVFPYASKPQPIIIFLDEGTGNYRAYTDDGVTVTNFDTGIAVDTATHTFDISFEPVGTVLTFKIDGATVQTQTTNIPTGNLAVLTSCQTSDTSAKTLQVDSLFIFNER